MTATANDRPAAWATLEQALRQRRPVRARYHDQERVLCPHALGWRHGRAKVLSYQAAGTSRSGLSTDSRQRWRCMFVDEIQDPVIIDSPWRTADNYTHGTNGIEDIEIEVPGVT
jgi:hypothetical protein